MYRVNDELDYDFEVGLDENGHPYLDFIFYDFGGFEGDVYVETDFRKKRKNHGKGYALCYWKKFDSERNIDENTQNYTWMSTDDIQLNKTYRLYIRFIMGDACRGGHKYSKRFSRFFEHGRPADWIVHLNVRLGFNGSFTNYGDNSQLKNFKNYKRISYRIYDEYEL